MADDGIPGNISKGPAHIAIDAQLNYQEDGMFVRRPAIRAALANSLRFDSLVSRGCYRSSCLVER